MIFFFVPYKGNKIMFAFYLFSFIYSLLKYTLLSQASKLIYQWNLRTFFF